MANPSWLEHADLMQLIIALLFGGFIWWSILALKRIIRNSDDLYKKYNDHEQRLSHLEGAHEARVSKLNCR